MNFWREKKNRKYILIILIPIILIAQYFLFKYGVISPLVKGVELNIVKGSYIQNIDEYVIKLGDTVKVDSGNYIMIPPYASEPKLEYKASEENILSVNGDEIVGIEEGYSALMITKNNRSIRKSTIRVVDPKVESLNVNMSNPIKYVGDSCDIEVDIAVNFDFNEEQKYTYEITNEDVIKIEDGKLKAVGVGSSKLIIKSGDKEKEYEFNDIQAKVSKINTDNKVDIEVNQTKKINVSIDTLPEKLKHPKVKYEIVGLKLNVARAISLSKDGTIVGVREGSEKVKITCGNKSEIVTINVREESIASKDIANFNVISQILEDKLEIIASWDYIPNIFDYEIYLRNNSEGETEFKLFKEIKIDKNDINKSKKIQSNILIELKDMEDPSIDLYVVGKSDKGYTKKSSIAKVRHDYKNPNKIENKKVENLVGIINEDNIISLTWDNLDNIDCTYSIYIKDNIKSQDGGFNLYKYGVLENSINIPIPNENIDMDIYVVADTNKGHSEPSKIIKIERIIENVIE